jgi:formate--tetrahydrofolate ligase
VRDYCAERGAEAFDCNHWADGGAGIEELTRKVVEMVDGGEADFKPLYADDVPLWEKTRTIAREIYGADDIIADKRVRDQFAQFQDDGFGHFPICMAKTQYSFSSDPALKGAPENFVVPIREVRLSAGAEFLVAICGDIMTMPGLPRVPAANSIYVNDQGEIEGLF